MPKTAQNSVYLNSLIKEFDLEILNAPSDLNDVVIKRSELNRPGLALTGFFEYFEPERIQILGRAESIYLSKLQPNDSVKHVGDFMSHHPVCVIIARNIDPFSEVIELANEFNVPLLRTPLSTTTITSMLISSLSVSLAPKITRHGVLVEVYGEGLLILGDSGIGKSETAIELIKRGHRLIADDAVEISKVSERTLVGTAPKIIRYYMELRGIGIIDVRRIFGMGCCIRDQDVVSEVNKQ